MSWDGNNEIMKLSISFWTECEGDMIGWMEESKDPETDKPFAPSIRSVGSTQGPCI